MPLDIVAELSAMQPLRAVERDVLTQHLATIEAECLALEEQIAEARTRVDAVEKDHHGRHLHERIGAMVLDVCDAIDRERAEHDASRVAVVANAESEAERLVSTARAEAAALRSAVARVRASEHVRDEIGQVDANDP